MTARPEQVLPSDLELRATETALIVVDLQVDFCSPHGKSAKSRHSVEQMLLLPSKVDEYAQHLADCGVLVVFTKAITDPETSPPNMVIFRKARGLEPPVERGSGGEELSIEVPAAALIIEKPYFDAFAYTSLKKELVGRGIEHLLVCGVRTEVCVDATARRASAEGFHTIILRDLVATRDANRNDGERALDFFSRYFGFVVASVDVHIEVSA